MRPIQEKVRSTTHRRGWTLKPFVVVAAADDLHPQDRELGDGRLDLPGVVAGVGPDELEPWEAGADAVEHEGGPVAILHPGGVNHDPERQALGVDERVDLASLHALAGVVAHLVVFRAPFSADFTVWLSSTPAEGDASRPSRSRSAM